MALYRPDLLPPARKPSGYRAVPLGAAGLAGGLNLRDQPDVVDPSQAIDLLNVTFTERGSIKNRAGYGKLTSAAGANRYDSLGVFYTSGGTRQLVCGAGARVEAINTSGAIVGVPVTTAAASPHYFARFGGPGAERLYIANGADTVRYWDGSAFTTPAYTGTTPTGRFLAVTPSDNRLVCARFTGTTAGSNPSSVRFSDPGVPHTFGANNFVDVTPGDGEEITGLAVAGPHLFVFKESRFFVFYGTATDSTGGPVFNFRPVESVVGLVSPRALAVSRDSGVYFMGRNGVYRTTGGSPQLVSDVVSPIWSGVVSEFFASKTLNHAAVGQAAMTWHDDLLYLAVPTGSATANDRTLVYDPEHGWWTLWSVPAAALAAFRIGNQSELVFAYAAGTNHVGRLAPAYTTDDGAAITSRWRSGWFDLGDANIKTVREAKLWGSGDVAVAVGKDFSSSDPATSVSFTSGTDMWQDGTGTDVWGDGTGAQKWGSGRTLAGRLARRAIRGTVFSIELAATKAFSVNRLSLHLLGGSGPPSDLGRS